MGQYLKVIYVEDIDLIQQKHQAATYSINVLVRRCRSTGASNENSCNDESINSKKSEICIKGVI